MGRVAVALIFAVALIVRLIHVWQMHQAPLFSILMGDARGYDQWAQRIAGGDWLGMDVFYQAPLYPYFLATIYSVFGRDLMVVRVVQTILGAASCVMLGLAAGRLFPTRVGLVAGLALALYAPAIFFDALIQKTVLDVFFICLALWILSGLVDRDAPARVWVCLGVVFGALALTRENALVFAAVVLAWIAWRSTGRARKIEAAAFVVGLALALVPVASRNYVVGGGFYVTTSQFGPNLYIGNNPRATGTYMSLRPGRGAPEYERQDATDLAEHAVGRTLTPSEVSSYWTRRALGFVRSQPLPWATLVGRKLLLLVNAGEMLDTESLEAHAEWSLLLRIGAWFGHFGVLVPLAVLGIIATWPDRKRLSPFYAMLLAYAVTVLAFYVFARYRFPLVPLLMLFASVGIVAIPALIAAGSPLRRAPLAAAVIAVIVFANWPVLSAATMRAVTENNVAVALQEEGRLDDAIAHYRRASTLDSTYAPAYSNMGTALRAKGQVDEAIAAYERALQAMPDYPDAHYNLANVLMDQNRSDEAARHLQIASLSLPGSASVHNNLGKALADRGRLEEATVELRRAVELDPRSAKANRNLGNVLASQGRTEEALAHLRRALEIEPNDIEAGYDLGTLLLEAGRAEEASARFQAIVQQKPDHAEARNNLGIALGSQGKLAEAIEQFQRALRIRPDFADAQRNLSLARAQVTARNSQVGK